MSTPTTIIKEPVKIIADIIQSELALSDDAVMLSYEKDFIPANEGLYVVMNYVGPGKIIANVNIFDTLTNEEVQQVTMLHVIQIDFMSFDASARIRKEEIAMALRSILSVQTSERYQMQIARMPTPFIDTSSLEETKRLNRFTTTVTVTALHTKRRPVGFFDRFNNAEIDFTANPPEVDFDA